MRTLAVSMKGYLCLSCTQLQLIQNSCLQVTKMATKRSKVRLFSCTHMSICLLLPFLYALARYYLASLWFLLIFYSFGLEPKEGKRKDELLSRELVRYLVILYDNFHLVLTFEGFGSLENGPLRSVSGKWYILWILFSKCQKMCSLKIISAYLEFLLLAQAPYIHWIHISKGNWNENANSENFSFFLFVYLFVDDWNFERLI